MLSTAVKTPQRRQLNRATLLPQAIADEELNRKLTEKKVVSETPPTEVQKRLAVWRATLNTWFTQTLDSGMGCK